MGHSIQYYEFEEEMDKGKIFALVNYDAMREGDYGDGLNSDIRFIDELHETRSLAEKAIESHDTGWYDQLAVKFYQYSHVKDTKKIENMRERIEKYEEDINTYKMKNSIVNRKSKFIGCSECESRINKEYISNNVHSFSWNCCPLCQNNLSSDTVKESIERRKARLIETQALLDKEVDINMRKGKKKTMWLVKTEFHV